MDILIRDVPDGVVSAIDARAQREGLSRTELLRRILGLATTPPEKTTVEDLRRMVDTFADLGDPEVMSRAWR